MTEKKLNQALDEFITRFTALPNDPRTEYDPEWLSPCLLEALAPGELAQWRPVLQSQSRSFADMEQALELALDPQLKAYFSRYYSDHIEAQAPQGKLTLLQIWNDDDAERLQQNLIGHVLMKRQLKQPETLFFALTDEEDFIVSVDNASGQVVLEQVGKPAQQVLAQDLAEFLATLQPLAE
ncbi:SecY-interacting protein [Alteromonas flava]|uniref:SecY-interacting protein n=1 Tax=Alteromonas flava TaxID=2048003 RepID=UPI000C287F0D|nr:SecY-interacting protein [Alteromonas flava]